MGWEEIAFDDTRYEEARRTLAEATGGILHDVDITCEIMAQGVGNAVIIDVQFRRTSLTGFLAQSIRSSNAIALDSPYLLVLITGTSQSRQHVDTSLIHLESRKSPTAELFDVDSGRISIHHCEY
ncbi:hypothetical protein Tco_1408162 [Tanacetum coccineum]